MTGNSLNPFFTSLDKKSCASAGRCNFHTCIPRIPQVASTESSLSVSITMRSELHRRILWPDVWAVARVQGAQLMVSSMRTRLIIMCYELFFVYFQSIGNTDSRS